MSSPANREHIPERPNEPFNQEAFIAMLHRGYDRHGEAFLAYLVLDGVEQRSLELVEQFEAAFIGYWLDRQSLVTSAIERLGWDDALDTFERNTGIWTDALDWNHDLIWHQLAALYRLNERLGGVYVFRR